MYKRALCFLLSILICVTVCGCSNDNTNNTPVVTPSDNEEDDIKFVVNSPVIEFPEFLLDEDSISRFSRLVYTSFDYEKINTVFNEVIVAEGGYNCDMKFQNGKLFRFIYNNNFGVIDDKGNVKLQGVYSSIRQLRPDLFELVYNGMKTYATLDEDNNFVFIEDNSFKWVFDDDGLMITQNSVEVGDNVSEATDGVRYYLKTLDGRIVYERGFDNIVESSKEDFDIECRSVYTAYQNGSCFVIVFDEFYNYRVYEGVYGNIKVTIGDNIGECYILNYEHYLQVINLFSCFDYEKSDSIIFSDNSVYVDFSTGKNSQSKYLLCENGYCEIYTPSEDGLETVKTVYKVSSECFEDVLDWINRILSTDYAEE